jgi:hypothetical protein
LDSDSRGQLLLQPNKKRRNTDLSGLGYDLLQEKELTFTTVVVAALFFRLKEARSEGSGRPLKDPGGRVREYRVQCTKREQRIGDCRMMRGGRLEKAEAITSELLFWFDCYAVGKTTQG